MTVLVDGVRSIEVVNDVHIFNVYGRHVSHLPGSGRVIFYFFGRPPTVRHFNNKQELQELLDHGYTMTKKKQVTGTKHNLRAVLDKIGDSAEEFETTVEGLVLRHKDRKSVKTVYSGPITIYRRASGGTRVRLDPRLGYSIAFTRTQANAFGFSWVISEGTFDVDAIELPVKVKLNSDYTAELKALGKGVQVGCQHFSEQALMDLYEALEERYGYERPKDWAAFRKKVLG